MEPGLLPAALPSVFAAENEAEFQHLQEELSKALGERQRVRQGSDQSMAGLRCHFL